MLKKLNSFINKTRYSKPFEFISLALIFAAYFIFINLYIDKNSVWFDEAFTSYIERQDFGDIIHYTAIDVHPPLYYLLLKFWVLIFGGSLTTLRAFSAVAGAICIALFYLLFKSFYTYRKQHPSAKSLRVSFNTVVACALFAFNPFFLRYCVEARMYVFDMLWALATSLVLNKIINFKVPSIPNRPNWISGADEDALPSLSNHKFTLSRYLRLWIAFTLLTVAGEYTHYYYIFVIIPQVIWYIASRKKLAFNAFSIGSALLGSLLYLPWVPTVLSQMNAVSHGFWIPPSTGSTFWDFWAEQVFFIPFDDVSTAILIGSIVIFALVIIRSFFVIRPRLLAYLIPMMVLAPLFLTLANGYVSRYAIMATVALALMATVKQPGEKQHALLRKVRPLTSVLNLIPIGILVLQLAVGVPNLVKLGNYSPYDHQKQEYINIVNDIKSQMQPGDEILVRDYFLYMEAAAYQDDTFIPKFENGAFEHYWSSFEFLSDYQGELKVEDGDAFIKSHHRVWVVTRENDGELRLFVEGKPVEEIDNLSHRDEEEQPDVILTPDNDPELAAEDAE